MQVCRTFLAIGYTVTAVKEPMAVVGMWKENRKLWIGVGANGNFALRALRERTICDIRCRSGWCRRLRFPCWIASSSIWIITCFQFDVPMQVCRTFLAIGYTVIAVQEPMAVARMWKEHREFWIICETSWYRYSV
jgi:hypothetical protein